MKAAQIIEPNKPLKISEIDTPSPTGKQVLIKVKAVGVCHSDLHLWEGGYDTGDGFMKVTDRGVQFPVTPGHEIVGTVSEIGDSVTGIEVGDDVLVYPWIGCGKCPTCEKGDTNLCDAPQSLGVFQDGGYAEYLLVPDFKFLIKISGIDLEGAASLACSGLTAYTAVKIKNSTVLENILIGALPRVGGFNSFFKRFSDLEIDNAKKILKQVGLQDKENRKIYMLSGGEKRRVAIARALVQKPEIILADEIVSELDHVTAREIMDVLAEAQATMNLTAIMVHHDLQLALEYADRVAVIKEGEKILEIGVEGDKIVDFQSGNYTQREILEMFSGEPEE